MHRHGYKGRKLGRKRGQRKALIKGLADSLILNESIETTLPKAKETVPYVEKLITKAKKATLANRRLIIRRLNTPEASRKLTNDIAPKLSGRSSGHLRIEKTKFRRGDNAQLAKVSFVDDLTKQETVKKQAPKPPTKKPAKKTGAKK
jgi:large subunit ribosomal protein L17